MRLSGPAVSLLALRALALSGTALGATALGATALGTTALGATALGAAAAAAPPDPGGLVRPSRALSAAIPTGPGTSSGAVRVSVNPVTGQLCLTTTGITSSPGTISGLAVAAPDGSRVQVTGENLNGCKTLPLSEATSILAAPTSYSVILTGTGSDLAAGPLTPAPALTRPWHVGTRSETIVDHTRGTARRGGVPASRARVIRLSYYYPARGSADASGVPASPEGPFPVVVFSPGYAVTPQTYALTLHAWAAAGYLVVGVLSPGSGGGLPGTPTEADLSSQPRDLSLALSTVARHTVAATSWLGGVADLSRVAVAGHSDGGSTAAAAGLLQRYSDPRWDAVIVMAGASFGGTPARKALPLLELSGQRDEYNSPATFARVFALGHTTRVWVQAVGARHLPPFVVAGRQADDLRALEVAFLDRSLLGAPDRSTERTLATVPGVTRVVAGGF